MRTLDDKYDRTLQEVAERCGVRPERARQVEINALRKPRWSPKQAKARRMRHERREMA